MNNLISLFMLFANPIPQFTPDAFQIIILNSYIKRGI